MRWPRKVAPFWAQVLSGVLLTTVFVLWVRGQWGGQRATALFSDVVSTLVPLGAAAACFYRSDHSEPPLRGAWRLLGAGCFAWAGGQAAWSVIELVTGNPPVTPSWADLGYLTFIPWAAWGIARFVRRDGQPSGYLRPVLDGLIMGSSFIFIVFVFGLEKILLASLKGDLSLTVNLLYPFGDAILFSMVLTRLSRADGAGGRSLWFLTAGTLSLVVADMWFLVVDAEGTYSTGGVMDAFWIIGFILIGLGAIRPVNLAAPMEPPPQSPVLAILPLVPFFVSMVAAMAAMVRDGVFSVTLFWTAFIDVALVVTRLLIMLLDNISLTQRAEAALAENHQAQLQRTQLLNNVTHDLLSPMSPVLIQLKILERPDLALPEKAVHSLDIIRRNVTQVKRLGEDLKDLANLEAGKFKVDHVPLDLGVLVAQAAESFHETGKAAGVQVQMAPAASLPVLGDKGRLTEVLYNLVSNAIRFTPAGGTVQVRADAHGSVARIEVQDSGRGLAADEIPRLFKPFAQVHERSEAKEKGTGLGLYVSRSIVEQHAGRIGVDSLGKGHGSTFWVEVPLAGSGKAVADAPGGPVPSPPLPTEASATDPAAKMPDRAAMAPAAAATKSPIASGPSPGVVPSSPSPSAGPSSPPPPPSRSPAQTEPGPGNRHL